MRLETLAPAVIRPERQRAGVRNTAALKVGYSRWILDPFDYASAFALSNVEWASAGQARSTKAKMTAVKGVIKILSILCDLCDLCVKTKGGFASHFSLLTPHS